MFGATPGMMFGGVFIWFIWLVVSIMALVAFFRGMNALVDISRRLENIEQILASRSGPGSTL
ncbi:MAG TPA: hypothetical protein VFY85_08665 [Gemmatimonadaceae bacterium]|nr:hypothetical protein [Gemmatimonadaceae bacterium]